MTKFEQRHFFTPPVTNTQCIIGTEKHLDSAILLNYDDDVFSQGYGQIKEAFKALTKDYIIQPYKSDYDFISNNNNNKDIFCNLYALDIQYQKKIKSAQPIKVEFKLSEILPAGVCGYVFALTI